MARAVISVFNYEKKSFKYSPPLEKKNYYESVDKKVERNGKDV